MDEVLASVAEKIKNFAVIYLVDITEVPDFNTMYELYDPSTVMFFFRNKHIMIDLGTGNNNKINWALKDKQEFIDIVETVYRGARKGRGLVVAPKDYSTKYRIRLGRTKGNESVAVSQLAMAEILLAVGGSVEWRGRSAGIQKKEGTTLFNGHVDSQIHTSNLNIVSFQNPKWLGTAGSRPPLDNLGSDGFGFNFPASLDSVSILVSVEVGFGFD
ncbi:mitosis protein dim1, putative [Ricinus communis]|uniref:Mitosis protein dim1, putative n=1 Tax=Ricinus communis TaxID=3988 RepID=B9SY41_RICCO|nr:mitosis protein dim1, putative [Ricinus communis]